MTVKQGETIKMEGINYDGIHLKNTVYDKDNPLIIDGQNKTVLWGFDKTQCKGPEDFNFYKAYDKPLNRTYGTLRIQDCHNVVIKNMEVWGGN
ncbi:unnamed protein product, partial [marine sediment metagenome]